MKTKHTPRPWYYSNHAGNHSFGVYSENDGRDLALVRNFDEAEVESQANARLIAAAPDLLEALKALHACHRGFSGYEGWTVLDDEARAFAEKAIAMAEGGAA